MAVSPAQRLSCRSGRSQAWGNGFWRRTAGSWAVGVAGVAHPRGVVWRWRRPGAAPAAPPTSRCRGALAQGCRRPAGHRRAGGGAARASRTRSSGSHGARRRPTRCLPARTAMRQRLSKETHPHMTPAAPLPRRVRTHLSCPPAAGLKMCVAKLRLGDALLNDGPRRARKVAVDDGAAVDGQWALSRSGGAECRGQGGATCAEGRPGMTPCR